MSQFSESDDLCRILAEAAPWQFFLALSQPVDRDTRFYIAVLSISSSS